jgi:hypothetical protein
MLPSIISGNTRFAGGVAHPLSLNTFHFPLWVRFFDHQWQHGIYSESAHAL